MKLSNILLVSMVSAVAAFAQNPITADSPYQIRYASNLTIGDSVVNISNTGARGGVTLQSGTSAGVGGAICANVFVFQPDEEIVYNFCQELHTQKRVSDASYKAVVDQFGEQGVMDLIAFNGYYVLVAMVLNVDRTPIPNGGELPLKVLK